MAEDMIERAAKAWVKLAEERGDGNSTWGERFRVAFAAALDPEDEALVLVTAKAMLGFAYPGTTMDMTTESNRAYFLARAREAVIAIRAHAQGGT